MKSNSPTAIFLEEATNVAPLRPLKSLASRYLLYPLAERMERRDVRSKVRELEAFYRMDAEQRHAASLARTVEMLSFAGAEVPYYRDLFARLAFDPQRVAEDPRRLGDLPLLTKDIIAEQGERMLSRPLSGERTYACKSGGSTGRSVVIHYDQQANDYSSAVTAYARSRIGAARHRPALHFAARFADLVPEKWPTRETFKTLAMNRSNIFFDSLDGESIETILWTIKRRRPYLVHGHPSTLAAIARHVLDHGRQIRCFNVFESSGELLQPRQRADIAAAFGCRIIDRYGLSELGVLAYQFDPPAPHLELLESECWAESVPGEDGGDRLVVTGLRNRLMPLIRYETGDLATVTRDRDGIRVDKLLGRIHDVVPINGLPFLTHHVQDVLDHRVQGVREFQIDLRATPPILRIAAEPAADHAVIAERIEGFWPGAFAVEFVQYEGMPRVGRTAKFRRVIDA
jgi:phenylacetate-CoA ligase